MLTLDSPFKDFIALCQKPRKLLNSRRTDVACDDSIVWMGSRNSETLGEALKEYLADADAPDAWSVYTIYHLHHDLTPEVLAEFAKKIKDPMTAFKMNERINFSPIVSAVLEPKYRGKVNG